jgi:flagellar hook-associated protein 2
LLVDRLHDALSGALTGATTQYVNLSSLGIATQKDGTVTLDESTLRAAIADDPAAAAEVLAGNGAGAGAANALADLIGDVTALDGALTIDADGFGDRTRELADQIDAGERKLTLFEEDLVRQFTALESLVSGLRSQSGLLTASLRNL